MKSKHLQQKALHLNVIIFKVFICMSISYKNNLKNKNKSLIKYLFFYVHLKLTEIN